MNLVRGSIQLDKKKEQLSEEQFEKVNELIENINELEENIKELSKYYEETKLNRLRQWKLYQRSTRGIQSRWYHMYKEREILFNNPRTDWSKIQELEYLLQTYYHMWIGLINLRFKR